MSQNFHNFSAEDAKKLAQTPAGKQLIALLQQNNPTKMQKAMESAAAGDVEQAKQMLSDILNSPEAMRLLANLRRAQP